MNRVQKILSIIFACVLAVLVLLWARGHYAKPSASVGEEGHTLAPEDAARLFRPIAASSTSLSDADKKRLSQPVSGGIKLTTEQSAELFSSRGAVPAR